MTKALCLVVEGGVQVGIVSSPMTGNTVYMWDHIRLRKVEIQKATLSLYELKVIRETIVKPKIAELINKWEISGWRTNSFSVIHARASASQYIGKNFLGGIGIAR